MLALAVSGTDLYVGGQFINAAGIAEADYVAKWNGSAWSALGSNGPGTGALNGYVNALAVSGSDLYVGGDFTNAAGIPAADYLAKWNGSAWSALGSNGAGDGALDNAVFALAVSGTDVYVGGAFPDAGGIADGRLPRQVGRQRLVRAGLERLRRWGDRLQRTSIVWPWRSPAPTSTWAVSSPTPGASRRPTASPSGTAATGPRWARTAPATGR